MNENNKQIGCNECYNFWQEYPNKKPNYLKASIRRHAFLYQCPSCKTFWEESERFAIIISLEEVEAYYGKKYIIKE